MNAMKNTLGMEVLTMASMDNVLTATFLKSALGAFGSGKMKYLLYVNLFKNALYQQNLAFEKSISGCAFIKALSLSFLSYSSLVGFPMAFCC